MNSRLAATVLVPLTVAVVAGCGGGSSSVGSAMSCSTYNTGNANGNGYMKNTNAESDLLLAHGINPGGNHHYDSAAGSYMMNVSVASEEIAAYCANHPDSTIDKGVNWSNFKKQ